MQLVQILLPLRDDEGRGFPVRLFDDVAHTLTDRFGGVTAFTRTPAEGRWKPDTEKATAEDIIVIEVMVASLDRSWWHTYRLLLERTFKQQTIVVRAQSIELL